MQDYDSHEEMSDSEDPDLLSELQGLDVDEEVAPPQVQYLSYHIQRSEDP
jgi:hypothetical protein